MVALYLHVKFLTRDADLRTGVFLHPQGCDYIGTWEPANNIKDAQLVRDWETACSKRLPEVWEETGECLEDEPVTVGLDEQAATKMVEEAVANLRSSFSEEEIRSIETRLLRAAKVIFVTGMPFVVLPPTCACVQILCRLHAVDHRCVLSCSLRR